MNLDLDRCSLVLIGSWNQAIFTPEWVESKLFPGDPAPTLEIGLGPIWLVRLAAKDMTIQVSAGQVHLRPARDDSDAFASLEQTAVELVRLLPETPIHAFGVNLAYKLDGSSALLERLFSLDDRTELTAAGLAIRRTKIVRSLDVDAYKLNLTIDRREGGSSTSIHFNYHADVVDATDAKRLLNGAVEFAQRTSTRLLSSVYCGTTE